MLGLLTSEAVSACYTAAAKPELSVAKNVDKYAVIEIGGTQLIVEEGRYYSVNRLGAEKGSTIQMGRVLAVKKDGDFQVGAADPPRGRAPRHCCSCHPA